MDAVSMQSTQARSLQPRTMSKDAKNVHRIPCLDDEYEVCYPGHVDSPFGHSLASIWQIMENSLRDCCHTLGQQNGMCMPGNSFVMNMNKRV